MSEKQWEIVEVGAEFMLDEETGMLIIKRPAIRYLLRKRDAKEVDSWEPVAVHT